jgi:hypothetical protein
MSWTAKDEAAYRQVSEVVADMTARREAARQRVAEALDLIPVEEGYFNAASAEALIRNADRIRDALAPFDTGVRADTGSAA